MLTPFYEEPDTGIRLFHGHVLSILKEMPQGSVQVCVTSPPYWGL